MNGKGFAQRLRHVIAKHESSLASAGDEIIFGRSFRRDAVDRPLPAVMKPALDPGFPTPLIRESRSFFGKHVIYDNPWAPEATAKSFREILQLLRTSKHFGKSPSAQERKRDLPHAEVELEAIANHKGDDPMRVTWVGHSTLLVQVDGLNILTDPMFSQRASGIQMMGPKRYSPPALEVSELPPIDLVLVSHSHYDHLDSGSVSLLGNGPIWLVPTGLKRLMASLGVHRCVELSWWEEVEVEGSRGAVRVASTPAQHWSQRGLFDRNTSLWCGYAVTGYSERFFFAGDTAYAPIFNQIGQRYGPFDLAAIPIGAYEPEWFVKDNHCGPDEAVMIHEELGAKRSLAVHWGTFPLAADLHIDAPRELVKACRARGLKNSEFSVLRHGESLTNDGSSRRYRCLFGSDDL